MGVPQSSVTAHFAVRWNCRVAIRIISVLQFIDCNFKSFGLHSDFLSDRVWKEKTPLYARQLHDTHDLPSEDFETQFTFAQKLSQEMKAATYALLVVSIPASSDGTGASPTAGVHAEEDGGAKGREALARLRNVFQRIATQWRPAIVVSRPEGEGDLVEFGGRDLESGKAEGAGGDRCGGRCILRGRRRWRSKRPRHFSRMREACS